MQIKLWPENEKRLKEAAKFAMRSTTMIANIALKDYFKQSKTKKNGSGRP